MSWFVLTNFFHADGRKIAGPYASQDDAIAARAKLEQVEGHHRYYIDEDNSDDVETGSEETT